MYKRLFHTTFFVCVLSLFCQSTLLADMKGNDWEYRKEDLRNRENYVEDSIAEYHILREHVETLIGNWSEADAAIKKGQ